MPSSPLERWQVRIDRRKIALELVQDELEALVAGVQGVSLLLEEERSFEGAPDGRAFRDFTPVAILTCKESAPLEYIAEELLELFGWAIDFKPVQTP
jgi:hypothetical protein